MERVAIGSVASVKSGFAFKSKDWKDDGVPVIKIANVKDGFVTLDGCSFVDEDVARSAAAFELKPGDILMSMTGYIGEVARVRNEGRMLLNQRVGKFNLKRAGALDSDYLFYCLRDPELKANFVAHAYGAAQPNISPTLIEQQEIPFPPLPIQRRIAGILSAYDELIENSQRRNKILESMARALYREWFVHFRFPGNESVSLVPSPLGDIPKGWACVRLADIGELTVGGDWGKDAPEGDDLVEVGCLRGVDLHAFARSGYSEVPLRWIKRASLEKRRVAPVDVLIEGSGECGRSLAGGDHLERLIARPVVYSNFCKRVRCRDASTARYVEYMLNSMVETGEMTQYRTGTTIPNLNMSALFEVHRFLLPPEQLLRQFVGLLSSSDAFKFSGRIQKLRRTRDLLLPRLMSGQIDVEALL